MWRYETVKEEPPAPLPIDLNMDFGEKSRVMHVLTLSHAGSVPEKRVAAAAIREFEGILDDLYKRPPKWEMVTLHRDEVENMRQIIKYQDKKLREVTERVNNMSHGERPKHPLPTFEDHDDLKARMDLATRFNAIYDREWRMAYSELYDTLKWKDEECIYSLMRVVRAATDLCYNLSLDQLDNLLVNMENTILNPLNGSHTRFKQLCLGILSHHLFVKELLTRMLNRRTKKRHMSSLTLMKKYIFTPLQNYSQRMFTSKEEHAKQLQFVFETLQEHNLSTNRNKDNASNRSDKFKQQFQGGNIKYTEGMKVGEKFALEYRRKRAEAAIPAVKELFMETKLRMIIDHSDLKREMKNYIEKVVEVIWLMHCQNPAMRIFWQQQTERVLVDFFQFYGRRGDFVNQTAWPAIFVHNTGKVLSKGYVLAM